MSKDRDSVGCSEFSPLKWDRLRYLLSVHIRMCRGIIEREYSWTHPRYHFVDLYAGPGLYSADDLPALAGMVGSPLIALNELARAGVAGSCFFVEPKVPDHLRRSIELSGFGPGSWEVLPMTCCEAVEVLASQYAAVPLRAFGLVFADPNGYPHYESLRRLRSVRAFERLDFLIHLNAAVNKRCLKSPLHSETKRPTEHLREDIGKRHIYLWRPPEAHKHQFTLAYCTDGPFPEFPGHGFHRIDSARGGLIARLIDYSGTERKAMGTPMGILPGFNVD